MGFGELPTKTSKLRTGRGQRKADQITASSRGMVKPGEKSETRSSSTTETKGEGEDLWDNVGGGGENKAKSGFVSRERKKKGE